MLRFCIATLLLLAALPSCTEAAESCAGKTDGSGVVAGIVDGATLQLADGRQLRLSGIEPPAYRDDAGDGAAVELLGSWLVGRTIDFRHSSAGPDRHGRMVAQVFSRDEDGGWVQARLISAGAGRVFVTPEQRACVQEMLALEAKARGRGEGIWSDAAFRPRQATDPELFGRDGVLLTVEGRVVSTGKTATALYVDFAGDRRSNFTAVIDARNASQFEKAGKGVLGLKGKWVRMRGWVYAWNGPALRLNQPEAVEIIEPPIRAERRRTGTGDADNSD